MRVALGACGAISLFLSVTGYGYEGHVRTVEDGEPQASVDTLAQTDANFDYPLAPETDLGIAKTDSADPVSPGDPLTYTLTISNAGPSDATSVTVVDTLPSAVTFVSSNPPCSLAGATLTCSLGELAAGGNATVTIDVTVNGDAAGVLVNTANVTGAETDPNPANNSAAEPTGIELTRETDLGITKTDSADPVSPGDPLTYTLTITNAGPSDATSVTVVDTLPSAVTFVSSSPPCSLAGVTLTCMLGELAAGGNAMVSIEVTVNGDATGVLVNTATVSGGETDPNPANNSATEPTAIEVTPQADLGVTKSDGQTTAVPGLPLTYTIVVSNAGPDTATGATVTDVLPAELTGPTWTCVASPESSCTPGGSGNINDTVNLAVGGTATYTVTGTVASDATGTLTNAVTVTPPDDVTDPNPVNDNAADVDTLTPETDLGIAKTDSADPVSQGDPLTYTLTITNAGPSDATAVTVVDTLPSAVTFVSSNPPAPICNLDGATLTCALGELAAGGNATVTIDVTVNDDATGVLLNTATVSGGETDPKPANNSASEPTSTGFTPETDLGITKTDSADPVSPGDPLTYTLTITNAGPSDATSVTVVDTLPSAVTFVSSNPPCNLAGATLTCALGELAAGGNATVTIDVTVNDDATGVLVNTATVSGDETDPNPANNSASQPTGIEFTPETDLGITKTDSADPVSPGDPLTYTLTITNAGPSDATSVIVVDTLPPAVTFVSSNPPAPICNLADAILTCALGELAAGGNATVTIDVTVNADATGVLLNTATVSGGETDPNPTNNSAAEPTGIEFTPQADLGVTKSDGQTTAVPGLPLTYTIVVSNAGPDTATGATVTDVLPAELLGPTWTCVASPDSSCTPGGSGNITDTVNLAAGGTATYTVTGTVASGATGTLTNTVTVTPGEVADPNPVDNSAADVDTLTPETDLGITKTDSADPVSPGDPLTYTLTITNAGPSDATAVTVVDTLPPAVTLVSSNPPAPICNLADATLTCALEELAAGGSVMVTIDVTVNGDATGLLINIATVSGGEPDPDPADNSASEPTSIEGTTAPNVVVFLVDDLDQALFDRMYAEGLLPSIRDHIGTQGTTFTNAFVTTGLCCPTRATWLTGQYSHNHGVLDNHKPLGGVTRFADATALPVWLKGPTDKYVNGLVGKYLNGYGEDASKPRMNPESPRYVPPGWHFWRALASYEMYGYTVSQWDFVHGGEAKVVKYGSAPDDYQTDKLATMASNFIGRLDAPSTNPGPSSWSSRRSPRTRSRRTRRACRRRRARTSSGSTSRSRRTATWVPSPLTSPPCRRAGPTTRQTCRTSRTSSARSHP